MGVYFFAPEEEIKNLLHKYREQTPKTFFICRAGEQQSLVNDYADIIRSNSEKTAEWDAEEKARLAEEIEDLKARIKSDCSYERNLEQHMKELEESNESLQRTVDNYTRIQRERANADREIRPKNRPGYLLISSEQYMERIHSEEQLETVNVWRSRWETYWESLITPYDVAYTNIRRDLMTSIAQRVSNEDTAFFEVQYDTDPTMLLRGIRQDINIIYRLQLLRNVKNGYWEVTMYHTKPLGAIPDDFRPPAGVKKKQ